MAKNLSNEFKKSCAKISVITATHNSAATLQGTLDSIARQSYERIEHIIIDGASTDDTIAIVQKNRKRIAIFKSESDTGIYDALNKGIRLASGEIIGFLHSDDFFASEDSVADIASAFEDPSVCGVYGDLEYVRAGDTSKVIRRWKGKRFAKRDLYYGWMPAHPTLYIRKEWYLKIGGFDTSYRIAADYLSIVQLFSDPSFNTAYIPKVLVAMRTGGASNRSFKAILSKIFEDYQALQACGFSGIQASATLIQKNLRKLPQLLP